MGVAFCGPPGPVFAEASRRGAARGFFAALTVEFGSLVGDSLWAVVGLSGAGLTLQLPAVHRIVAAAGAALLTWLGLVALRDVWMGRRPVQKVVSAHRDFAAGAALSLANPQSVAYWVALGSGVQAILGHAPRASDYAVFFLGFMLACLAYCFIAAGMIAGARRLMTDRLFRVANAACGLALIGFAVLLAAQALG